MFDKKKDSQPTEAAPLREGLIAKLESELAAERAALEKLSTRASGLKDRIAVATGRGASADALVEASPARAAVKELEKDIGKRVDSVSILEARLDHFRRERARLVVLGNRLSAEVAPYESVLERMAACVAELKAIAEEIKGTREQPYVFESVFPIAGILGRQGRKQAEMANVRKALTELGE